MTGMENLTRPRVSVFVSPARDNLACPILFLLMALAACRGGGSGSARQPCVPGMTAACSCTDGSTGAQSCNPNGSGYGVCTCSGPGTDGAAGAGGGGLNGGAPSTGGATGAGGSGSAGRVEIGGRGTGGTGGVGGEDAVTGGSTGAGGTFSASGGARETGGTSGGAGRPGTGGATGGVPGTGGVGTGGSGGCRSSVSGTVWDPSGKLPIYNAIVFAPSAPLSPIPVGVSCDRCSVRPSGNPVATTFSDSLGRFRLDGMPSGSNVPMVIQIGKWRRQVTVPLVAACADTPITDANLTRLPRTKAEGNIPMIAVTTGGSDAFECLLRRMGIADSEFTADAGSGRVHLYAGGNGTNSFSAGGAFTPAATLWANAAKLTTYDLLIQSCEGSISQFADQKPQTSVDNLAYYVNSGGRLLLSHLHFSWLQRTPAFSGTAAYVGTLTPPPADINLTINQTFPKGMAFAQWLAGPIVNASPTTGQVLVKGSEHSVTSVNALTTEWMYLPNNPNDSMNRRSVQHLSFSTPVGAAEAMQCGRVGFSDIHVKVSVGGAGGDDSDPGKPFPTGCMVNEMTGQQKALEFLFFDLFDLASCVQAIPAVAAAP